MEEQISHLSYWTDNPMCLTFGFLWRSVYKDLCALLPTLQFHQTCQICLLPTSIHTFFFLENSQVRLVLFICASLCDHPLEQGKHISCHTINDKWFSLTQLPRATQWGEWSQKVSLLLCQNCGWLVFVQVMCRLLGMPHNVCKTAFHAAPVVLQHNPNQFPYDLLHRTCFLMLLSLACCYFRNMKFFIRLCIRNIYDLFLKVDELQLSF